MASAGTIVAYGGAAAPTGWLLCDGSAVSRTTYAALFTAIGTTFGVGDGSTTFNLPDLRDRFPLGKSGTKALGSSGGALAHTHTGPSHTHPVTQPSAHAAHVVTQPGSHGTHSSDGGHAHDDHTTTNRGSGSNAAFTAPTTHATGGAHTHDAHSAHTGAAVDAHSAHSGAAITAAGTGATGSADPPYLALTFIIATG